MVKKEDFKIYTREDVKKHNTREDAWVIVDDNVYDVTEWIDDHPGGSKAILHLAGHDGTILFMAYHPKRVLPQLRKYQIGKLKDKKLKAISEYTELHQILEDAGCFKTTPFWYIWKYLLTTLILVVAIGLVVYLENYPLLQIFIAAPILGLYWQQAAFLGHDAGHSAITHNRAFDLFMGQIFLTPFLGISSNWWRESHNTHHIATNSITDDPDIQHMPIFAVSSDFFEEPYSSYYDKRVKFEGIAKILIRYQHLLFYPIMCVARWFLYLRSFDHLLRSKDRCPGRWIELGCLVFFFIFFTTLVMTYVHGIGHRIAFLMVCHAVAGILHVQICLSHFAMETYQSDRPETDSDDWLEAQVKTTLDIKCSKFMDWFHGGLQFQLEHHLFPRIPRKHLRKSQDIIIPFCNKLGLDVANMGFYTANKLTYTKLKNIAEASSTFSHAKIL